MCLKYSKLPTDYKENYSTEDSNHSAKKQLKWRKVKKTAEKVCCFIFSNCSPAPIEDANRYSGELSSYYATYAMGGIEYL